MTQVQTRPPSEGSPRVGDGAPSATIAPRRLTSILVHAEPGARSKDRVAFAVALAKRTGAHLEGVGAETFDPAPADPYFGYAAADWIPLIQEQINADLESAEAAFRAAAKEVDCGWRAVQGYPSRVLASQSLTADLIVMSPRGQLGRTLCADPAEVIMHAGRPVLLVPEGTETLQAKVVVVAWKNTREARRAVIDALPLLQTAEDVIVQGIASNDDMEQVTAQTADVAEFLARHGVPARANVIRAANEVVTLELERIANLEGADLIVAGAYGHARMAEWAFGGVTDDLLHHPFCCVLLSH